MNIADRIRDCRKRIPWHFHWHVAFYFAFALYAAAYAQDTVDATTLVGKYMLGYQGWFWAPGDGSGSTWANHWFRNNDPSAAGLVVDMFPDLREYDSTELFPTAMRYSNGATVKLYSAYTEKTVVRQFKWMRDYQLDGVWVQRFLTYARSGDFGPRFNKVLQNCRKGAEEYGRVFVVMYDLSGTNSALLPALKTDWMYLVDSLKITESPRYLRHKGKPLVSIWGLGFADRPQPTPAEMQSMIKWFQTDAPPRYQATVMGGTNNDWRTIAEPWASTLRSLDIISPWLVGRFGDTVGANNWKNSVLIPDIAEAKRVGKEYLPVIWPGFSWHNLFPTSPENQIKRLGGKFFWTQVYNSIDAGSTMLYNAMFDEINEGTAMYKLCPKRSLAPQDGFWVTLDADGYDNLPSDWYLRLACYAKKMLIGKIPKSKSMPIDPAKPDSLWTGIAGNGSGEPLPGRSFSLKNGTLTVTSGTAGESVTIGVYRIDGRLIKTIVRRFVDKVNSTPVYSKGEIAPGVYIIGIKVGNGSWVLRQQITTP